MDEQQDTSGVPLGREHGEHEHEHHDHRHDHPDPVDGRPEDELDCSESLEALYVFLDGELTIERRTEIRGHLDDCVDCYGAYDFEAELRSVISASCREEVPQHLRERVAEALRRLQG